MVLPHPHGTDYPYSTTTELTKSSVVLNSSKGVHISAAESAGGWGGSASYPWPGSGIELGCCQAGGLVDLGWSGEGLSGQGRLAEGAPPAFLEVQPAGADRYEDVPDPG